MPIHIRTFIQGMGKRPNNFLLRSVASMTPMEFSRTREAQAGIFTAHLSHGQPHPKSEEKFSGDECPWQTYLDMYLPLNEFKFALGEPGLSPSVYATHA